MTAIPVPATLLERLLGVLVDVITPGGHAAQIVSQERMGVCTARRHSDRCNEYAGLLLALTDILQTEDARVAAEQPVQVELFHELDSGVSK